MSNKTDKRAERKAMETRLSVLQQQVVQAKIPVIIIFEGFSAAGKGDAISSLILNFDPRGFDVYATRLPEKFERRKPWMARFAEKIPARGRIAVFDRAWYSGMTQVDDNLRHPAHWITYLDNINTFESQLLDDGYIIIKFFLHISKKEQKKRLKKLMANRDTVWRVTKRDLGDLKRYGELDAFYHKMLESTDRPNAKWHFVDATSRRHVRDTVYATVTDTLEGALACKELQREPVAPDKPFINVKFNLSPTKPIGALDLSADMNRMDYRIQLGLLQKELKELHNVIYKRKMPVILAFEGNDAAGKGGSIKRVAAALDPRGYTVIPIGAPTPDELNRHYLWRFYKNLPKTGHIAIFDRTWYGRVLVERVEGFTPMDRVMQAYNEINEFESMLHEWGALVLKFWMAIDKDEQLHRFEDRQNTPEKRWKITEEDWRNRDKWDDYEAAVDDMIRYTNTGFAPWHVVESNCKMYARIKTLHTVVQAVKERLKH